MKTCYQVIFGIALLFLLSCSSKTVVTSTPPIPVKPPANYQLNEQSEMLFADAEQLFNNQAYSQALSVYHRYLANFPNGAKAPLALLRLGSVQNTMGNSTKALLRFEQLITTYPASPLASEAMIRRLLILYGKAHYQEIIDQAEVVLARDLSTSLRIRLYDLLGNTYTAVGYLQDAIYYYAQALELAQGDARKKIVVKLKETLRQLSSDDMVVLLPRLQDTIAGGYLLFQLGMNQVNEGRYEMAIDIISTLIRKFPRHEHSDEARKLLEEIQNKPTYERYTVGCLVPLSGRYHLYGQKMLNGIQLALEQFATQRPDLNIRLIIKDTESDSGQTVRAVRELSEQRTAAIIGPIFAAEEAAVEAQSAGIPIITLTQKKDIPLIGDWVFRNFITPQLQAKSLVSFALNTLRVKDFAILYPNENYGNTFMNLFWDELNAQGGRVTGVEAYQTDQTDFAGPINKLKKGRYSAPEKIYESQSGNFTPIDDRWESGVVTPESLPRFGFGAVFIPDAPKKVGLILPQLAYHDIENVYLLGTNLWHSDALIRNARQYAQGAICAAGFFAQSDAANVQNFTEQYEKTFQTTPDFMAAVSYDTAMILFQAISRPNTIYRSALKYGLMNLNAFQGVTGSTSFDETGEVNKELFILQLQQNRFVEITSEPDSGLP